MLRNIYILVDRTSVNSISLCLFGCFLIAKCRIGFPRTSMCKCFVWCSVCCSTQTRLFLCTCLRHQCQSFAFQHDRPPKCKNTQKKKKRDRDEFGTTENTTNIGTVFNTTKKHHASTSTTTHNRPPDYTRTLSNLPRTTFACVLFSVLPVPDWPFESPLALL